MTITEQARAAAEEAESLVDQLVAISGCNCDEVFCGHWKVEAQIILTVAVLPHVQSPSLTEAVEEVKRLRDEIDSLIAEGKGTWPQSDYVRDAVWASWQGQQYAYNKVLDNISTLQGKAGVSEQEPTADKFIATIADSLRHVVRDHGPITKELIGSAAKRVWSRIKGTKYDPFRNNMKQGPIGLGQIRDTLATMIRVKSSSEPDEFDGYRSIYINHVGFLLRLVDVRAATTPASEETK